MGEDVSLDKGEGDGFSRLDLVKHSMKTIVNIMSPNDMLSIISFHSNAQIEFNL
jgi:hypothetical protein